MMPRRASLDKTGLEVEGLLKSFRSTRSFPWYPTCVHLAENEFQCYTLEKLCSGTLENMLFFSFLLLYCENLDRNKRGSGIGLMSARRVFITWVLISEGILTLIPLTVLYFSANSGLPLTVLLWLRVYLSGRQCAISFKVLSCIRGFKRLHSYLLSSWMISIPYLLVSGFYMLVCRWFPYWTKQPSIKSRNLLLHWMWTNVILYLIHHPTSIYYLDGTLLKAIESHTVRGDAW